MKKILIPILLLICHCGFSQQLSLKQQGIDAYIKENYAEAISLMEKARIENPNDAEVYYYLGRFSHYNANDSRPLKDYDISYSEKIWAYLDKAIELNPNYGDAKYFYSAECAAAAFKEYNKNNLSKVRYYYEKAYKRGVIPEWGIEFGKNMLNTCERNAILFTHGDFSLNMCLFVQLHYNFRKDITIVPLSLLDRPSFVLSLSNNESSKNIRGLKTGLTKGQIMDMHPYKWDTVTIKLPVSEKLIKEYSLANNFTMDWVVEPDLTSNRIVSKIDGETPRNRTFLSPARGILLSIIETNNWERPIYFYNGFESYYLAKLDSNFQNCGLISKLTPIKTKNTNFNINVSALENLVFNTKLEKLSTVIKNDQPRVSGSIYGYYYSYLLLADYYSKNGRKGDVLNVIDSYKQNLMIGFKPEDEKWFLNELEKMK